MQSGRRRGDLGLSTLSWLLITAAVAGFAALAVVVVQERVENTAEGISASDARVTAAVLSASVVEGDATAASAGDFALWGDWETHFTRQCHLIAVLYADAEVHVVHNDFNRATGGSQFDAAAAGYAAAADNQSPTAAKAQVRCEVA